MNDLVRLQRLAGRKFVITGGAAGIGNAIAKQFLFEGATVSLFDLSSEIVLPVVEGGRCKAFQADVTDISAVECAVAKAAVFMGGIDGVVNAAGIMAEGSITDMPVAEWRRIIEVNLFGTYTVARVCVPWLKQSSGSTIVNIASAQGLLSNAPALTAYATSKGAVVTFTRSLAADQAPAIRVNCVCPGMVDTQMADGYRQNVGNYALKRLADPLEIAKAVLFLSSDDSSYVTGAALSVDGGRSFH